MSLLAKALKTPVRRRAWTPEKAEEMEALAVAFLRGEVNTMQVSTALGTTGSGLYSPLAIALRDAVMAGRIRIEVLK